MGKRYHEQTDFRGGEQSARLDFQFDIDGDYNKRVKQANNLIISPLGNVRRRPVTRKLPNTFPRDSIRKIIVYEPIEGDMQLLVVHVSGNNLNLTVYSPTDNYNPDSKLPQWNRPTLFNLTTATNGVTPDVYDELFWEFVDVTLNETGMLLADFSQKTLELKRNDNNWSASVRDDKHKIPYDKFNREVKLTTSIAPTTVNPDGHFIKDAIVDLSADASYFEDGSLVKYLQLNLSSDARVEVETVQRINSTSIKAKVVSDDIPTLEFDPSGLITFSNDAIPQIYETEIPRTAVDSLKVTQKRQMDVLGIRSVASDKAYAAGGLMYFYDSSSKNLYTIDPEATNIEQHKFIRRITPKRLTREDGTSYTPTTPIDFFFINGAHYFMDAARNIVRFKVDVREEEDADDHNATEMEHDTTLESRLGSPRFVMVNGTTMTIVNTGRVVFEADLGIPDVYQNGRTPSRNYTGMFFYRPEGDALINLYGYSGGILYRLDPPNDRNGRYTEVKLNTVSAGKAFTTGLTASLPARKRIDPDFQEQYKQLKDSLAWQEEAWSDSKGWPNSYAYHEGRLLAGGTKVQPHYLFGSKNEDPTDFRDGPNDTDGFIKILPEYDLIRTMSSSTVLHIFGRKGYYAAGTRQQPKLSPTVGSIRQLQTVGSERIRSYDYRQNQVYAGHETGQLNMIVYGGDDIGYGFENLSELTHEGTRIIDTAFVDYFDTNHSLFIVLYDDGTVRCLSLTNLPSHLVGLSNRKNMRAWSTFTFPGMHALGVEAANDTVFFRLFNNGREEIHEMQVDFRDGDLDWNLYKQCLMVNARGTPMPQSIVTVQKAVLTAKQFENEIVMRMSGIDSLVTSGAADPNAAYYTIPVDTNDADKIRQYPAWFGITAQTPYLNISGNKDVELYGVSLEGTGT